MLDPLAFIRDYNLADIKATSALMKMKKPRPANPTESVATMYGPDMREPTSKKENPHGEIKS